jgi:long-chain acyl-CoA synthetase
MAVAVQFATIPELFARITEKYSRTHRPVLMHKADGVYVGISYGELRNRVERFAFGLASLGIRRGDRVAIISENRPEWVVADMAIVSLGAIDVPLYPTMTAKQVEYIFNDSGVKAAIVSNQFQLNKVMRILGEVPSLERVVLMTEKGPIAEAKTIGFSRVYEAGDQFRTENPDHLKATLATVKPEDILTVIYTSGTTGNPKGVVLTHNNLVTNVVASAEVIAFGESDVLLSFLPLCHTFERMAGYYTAFACGATIAYAESVDTVRDNMIEIRPTIVTTVPRLFERIHSRVLKQVESSPAVRQKIFHWGVQVGRDYARMKREHRHSPWLWLKHAVAARLVHSKLKARTGGRMRFFVSGGAALAREFGEFFEAVGLTIIEGYGLTESSPVITVNRLGRHKWGSVGPAIPGVEVKIASDGEILARGPNIMQGYWNNPLATEEAIDKQGWLHTGDIGMIDAEGYLFITDRKKHMFVSSGGKNIAPQPIENMFLSNKFIEQFMLIGDRRMYLTALIVPDFDALKEFADSRQIPYRDNADLAAHPQVNELLEREITAIQKDLANYERVRKFTLLEKQFSIEEGELTPSQKVRRKVVEQKYQQIIDGMYDGVS